MNALRPDEELDNMHSVYVDQWDWEKAIYPEERTLDYLKMTVQKIRECVQLVHRLSVDAVFWLEAGSIASRPACSLSTRCTSMPVHM